MLFQNMSCYVLFLELIFTTNVVNLKKISVFLQESAFHD